MALPLRGLRITGLRGNRMSQKIDNLEKKKLLASQTELILMKRQALSQIISILKQRDEEMKQTVNRIAIELEIPEAELGLWGLSDDMQFMVRFGKKKRPKFPFLRTFKKKKDKKSGEKIEDKKPN
jgi:hypothetical protein